MVSAETYLSQGKCIKWFPWWQGLGKSPITALLMRIINILNLDVLEMSMNIIAERRVSLNITNFLNVTILLRTRLLHTLSNLHYSFCPLQIIKWSHGWLAINVDFFCALLNHVLCKCVGRCVGARMRVLIELPGFLAIFLIWRWHVAEGDCIFP